MNNATEINKIILSATQSVVVHTPKYSKFGGYEGTNDIYTMDIADAIDKAGYIKVVKCKDCKHKNPYGYKCLRDNLWHDDDDYCNHGERRG